MTNSAEIIKAQAEVGPHSQWSLSYHAFQTVKMTAEHRRKGIGAEPQPPWECVQSSTCSRTDTWVFFSRSVLGRRARALLPRPPLALHFSPTGSLALLLFFGSFIKEPL